MREGSRRGNAKPGAVRGDYLGFVRGRVMSIPYNAERSRRQRSTMTRSRLTSFPIASLKSNSASYRLILSMRSKSFSLEQRTV
jgi:hypothetical protein